MPDTPAAGRRRQRRRALRFALALAPALAVAGSAAPGAPRGPAKMDALLALIEADPSLPRDRRVEAKPRALRRELVCVALAIFHEARSEIPAGRYAVAMVARNRADARGATLCAVVWAPRQFSWTAHPLPRLVPREPGAWARSLDEACDVVLDGMKDITGGADHFFNPASVFPAWARRAVRSRQIGAHRFLRLSPLPPAAAAAAR